MMFDMKYTYAVARLRALEVHLLSAANIDQLMACDSEESCLQLLTEKGWGDPQQELNADHMLQREIEKIWETMDSMHVDMSVFDVLRYPDLYHNLKAAIKEICREGHHPGIYMEKAAISGGEMEKILREKEYYRLPDHMQAVAREAYETLLHTRDGQLCDVIVDRACLEAILRAGEKAETPLIREYAESTVAIANIKIAVRAQKTGKSEDFARRAMAPCKTISVEALAKAVVSGFEAICECLTTFGYGECAEALRQSPSAFECWCDNRVIATIRPQKYEASSIGPLVAYVLARENEIKTVRIILSGKANNMPDEKIRERIREMYV